MKTQNRYGMLIFFIAFAIVLTLFSFFIPKSSNTRNSSSDSANEKQKPWEMDWSHAKQSAELKPFHGKTDEELALEHSQGYLNQNTSYYDTNSSNIPNQPTYKSPRATYHDNPNYENESNSYVYRTQPTYLSNSSSQTTDYYQNQTPENNNSSNYNTTSSYSDDSYSARMPQRQSSTITNCDGAGCWGSDGTRYNRGAGDTYFPSTGGSCQSIGGQMQCN